MITQHFTTPSGARIPPAWTDVWMTDNLKSGLQASGRDSKGRKVYLYSSEHMGMAASAKFTRLKEFSKAYRSLIKKIRADMKTSEEALVLYLISKTGFRIGGDSDTLAAVKAFGASTLRCPHVSVKGNKLTFNFIGKKGTRTNEVIKDKFLAGSIVQRCGVGGDEIIFRTTDKKIRDYLNSISAGSKFEVKDFRTYVGTMTAFHEIQKMSVPRNVREFNSYKKQVAKTVAKKLGNSPAIALRSYISPTVFCAWETNDALTMKAAEFLECVDYD